MLFFVNIVIVSAWFSPTWAIEPNPVSENIPSSGRLNYFQEGLNSKNNETKQRLVIPENNNRNMLMDPIKTHEQKVYECAQDKFENTKYSGYLSQTERVYLVSMKTQFCMLVLKTANFESESKEVSNIDIIISGYYYNYAVCENSKMNTEFREDNLRGFGTHKRLQKAIVRTFNLYCLETSHLQARNTPFEPQRFKSGYRELETKKDWLNKEFLCNVISFQNLRGGKSRFFLADLPSIKTFETETDKICNQLKEGKLSYSSAMYYYEQENEKLEQTFKPDMAKKLSEWVIDSIKFFK